MTCSFCGSRNSESDDRCGRCGRRPGDTLNGEFSLVGTQGALATQFAPSAPRVVAVTAAPPPGARRAVRGVQQSLFPDGQSNLIQFEEYALYRPASKSPGKSRAASRKRSAPPGQGSLDFAPQPAAPKTLSTTVDAVVSCDFPVATTMYRAAAAAVDCGVALIAYGMFLAVFYAMGGVYTWNRLNLIVFAGALLLIGFSYGLTWTLLGADSFGMRWVGLRLTTFEGFPLERKHRVMRFAGSCLSLCTVLGQLWSLWDEEGLTWQDHISGTFPTPLRAQAQVFRRA